MTGGVWTCAQCSLISCLWLADVFGFISCQMYIDPNINTFVKIDLLLYNFEAFVCVLTYVVGENGFTLL